MLSWLEFVCRGVLPLTLLKKYINLYQIYMQPSADKPTVLLKYSEIHK